MSLFEIFLTALSLSLDAVAVSIAASVVRPMQIREAFKVALFFGFFQFVMPILGSALGMSFQEYLLNYGNIIGFTVLFLLGLKMLFEALKKPKTQEVKDKKHITNTKVLFLLALATSIDAFVIGVTFNFISVNILLASIIIGILTFLLSLLGIYIGSKGTRVSENKVEIFGALILIGLAFKILLF